jgi:crotonobetainyl-CoA:carnitine CoA-transferase CaiB-like acyl-CoA transferase
LSETPAVLRWAAPLLGEHTKYVLKELLGYSDPQIQDMAARQILE